ncbi:MAG TPA: hypothetical protein VN774_02120 [Candidatus Limnocylindrales bacterium]|nr:hypothetical protein [Candidatus Limnocylindrales bacterium]
MLFDSKNAGSPISTSKSTGKESLLRSVFRNPLLYTTALLVLGLIYVGGVFLVRWQEDRDFARRDELKKAQERANAQRDFESLGGSNFEILNFYVSPAAIRRGEVAELCYSVSNTKAVRLDPPAGNVWPSLNRCVDISPKKTTTYTLTAEDAGGHTKTSTVTLPVQ